MLDADLKTQLQTYLQKLTRPVAITAALDDGAKSQELRELLIELTQLSDQVTLREFDPLLLPPVEPLEPAEIKRIRESAHVSQAVFARLLNTSLSTVQKWEIGQKRPAGTALKLLHLVQKRGLEVVA